MSKKFIYFGKNGVSWSGNYVFDGKSDPQTKVEEISITIPETIRIRPSGLEELGWTTTGYISEYSQEEGNVLKEADFETNTDSMDDYHLERLPDNTTQLTKPSSPLDYIKSEYSPPGVNLRDAEDLAFKLQEISEPIESEVVEMLLSGG